jgi:CheY-like chemotaxis protein
MPSRPVEVLLVEDDPGDVDLIQDALSTGMLRFCLHVVDDGVKALEYVRQQSPYEQTSRPDLILLDLNLPRKDGREVLRELKEDPQYRSIPIVVLTTSESETDIANAYRLSANCYITKPVGITEFTRVAKGIEDFWCGIVKLPPR